MTQWGGIRRVWKLSNTRLHLIYGVLIALALIVAGLSVREAVNEHISSLLANNTIQVRNEEQAKKDAEFDTRIKNLTPAQATEVIEPVLMKGAKNAIGAPVSVPKASLTPEVQAQLPDAPQVKSDALITLLTPPQMVVLGQRELACQKTEGELSTCKANLATLQTEKKGGTVFQKVKKEVKCLSISTAGAGLGSKLGGWKGAMIGSLSGEAGCKIFF